MMIAWKTTTGLPPTTPPKPHNFTDRILLDTLTRPKPSAVRRAPATTGSPLAKTRNVSDSNYGGVSPSSSCSSFVSPTKPPRLQKLKKLNMASATPPRPPPKPVYIDITAADDISPSTIPAAVVPPASIPKSPGLVLQNFFGWKSRDDSVSSAPNETPDASPRTEKTTRPPPDPLDISRANASSQGYFGTATGPLPEADLPMPPASSSQVAELENELREISTELAQSIKREMELEEEIDRLKSIAGENTNDSTRRNSDYFSDSGTSSKYGESHDNARIDELDRLRRKAEQEKAQVKLDMSNRMAEVMKQRRLADDRILLLEEHVQTSSRNMSPVAGVSADLDRVRQLEFALDEMKRKLDEERRNKASMEELIGGMRHEIQQFKGERDHLRDELVPQLESKLANLEVFVSEGSYLPSDRSINPVSEDGKPIVAGRGTMRSRSQKNRSRSNSAVGNRSRSASNVAETRDQLFERAKDLEAHKDALHRALKQLLGRHHHFQAQHARKINALEMERKKSLASTPRRSAYRTEVKNLRSEIIDLRKRADDALDQKWNWEKGLSSLKMDLDRAREDSARLRTLLRQNDISVPTTPVRSINSSNNSAEVINQEQPLYKLLSELQTTHALSLAHINDLASPDGTTIDSSKILALLKQSLSTAESDRNSAHQASEQYRLQVDSLKKPEMSSFSKQADTQLLAATSQMDKLSQQVRSQMNANEILRKKLSDALQRGEREQDLSESRVREMQGRLSQLEDQLVRAQQDSERAMASHEDDVRALRETTSGGQKLQRSTTTTTTMLSPPGAVRAISPPKRKSSLLGSLGSAGGSYAAAPGGGGAVALSNAAGLLSPLRSPRGELVGSGGPKTLPEATGHSQLEQRVKELERALTEAESEMSAVVSRMTTAQIEVAQLQNERDLAAMRSRKLQAEVEEQREQVRSLMARR